MEPTVGEVAEGWLAERAREPLAERTMVSYRQAVRLHIVPGLGSLPVSGVTRADVLELHRQLVLTPSAGNLAITTARQIFSWAEDRGLREPGTNPALRIKPYPTAPRCRYPTEEERGRLWGTLWDMKADGSLSESLAAGFALLLLTGMRRSEVFTLPWSAVDWSGRCLRLVKHKTSRTAGPKVIYPGDAAFAILESLRGNDPEWVFPGRKPGKHVVDPWRSWQRVLGRAGFEARELVLHDARRGWATAALDAGIDLRVIQQQFGHASIQTTARYAQVTDHTARRAAATVEDTLLGGVKR